MTIKALVFGAVALCLFSGCSLFTGKKPDNLGVMEGRLSPCPDSPNCVSSQADDDTHGIAPLPLTVSPAEAMARIVSVLEKTPRVTLVTRTDTYLHAEVRSALFRFVDDLEVHIDEASRTIHFRSASRTGYSDFGVNRKRVERLKNSVSR